MLPRQPRDAAVVCLGLALLAGRAAAAASSRMADRTEAAWRAFREKAGKETATAR